MKLIDYIRPCAVISFIVGLMMYGGIIGISDPLCFFVGHIIFMLSLFYLIVDGNISLLECKSILWGVISSVLLMIGIYGIFFNSGAIPFISDASVLGQFLQKTGLIFLLLGGGSTGVRAIVIIFF